MAMLMNAAKGEERMGNRPQAVGMELEVIEAADMAGSGRVKNDTSSAVTDWHHNEITLPMRCTK